MGLHICTGAMLQCTMGLAPSTFNATPRTVMTSNRMAGNIMDHVPMLNIMPFGACTSPANPTVAAATTAAMGVLTPMPCFPATVAPWVTGSPTVLVENMPALNDSSKLTCLWAGMISVTVPGQFTEMIP